MSLDDFQLIGPVAYQGKKDCSDPRCRRYFGPDGPSKDCIGYHCPYCDAACSMMGHKCDAAEAVLGESRRIIDEATS